MRSWRVLRSAAPPTAPPSRGVVDRAPSSSPLLWRPLSRPAPSGQSPSCSGNQARFRRRLVKAGDFLAPERLPSTSAPSRGPATVRATLPPRAGFRRRFAPRAAPVSRLGRGARPSHRCGGRAPLVDFCNQMTREHVLRTDRSSPSFPRRGPGSEWVAPPPPRTRRPVTRRSDPSRDSAGQGPGGFRSTRRLPTRLLVSRALPQPAWLGHLTSWTRDRAGWMVRTDRARRWRAGYVPTRRGRFRGPTAACRDPLARGSRGAVRSRETARSAEGRLPCSSAKRGTFRCTRGVFRTVSDPGRGRELSTGCHQTVDYCRRLFDPLADRRPLTGQAEEWTRSRRRAGARRWGRSALADI